MIFYLHHPPIRVKHALITERTKMYNYHCSSELISNWHSCLPIGFSFTCVYLSLPLSYYADKMILHHLSVIIYSLLSLPLTYSPYVLPPQTVRIHELFEAICLLLPYVREFVGATYW